jgi:hydrogenase nickel incorporation protein HypA/HybF
MHEVSIALSIVDAAAEEAERQGGGRVVAVHLKLGPLSGAVKEALTSAFELAREGSPLADCELGRRGGRRRRRLSGVRRRTARGVDPANAPSRMRYSLAGNPPGRELEVVALEIVS